MLTPTWAEARWQLIPLWSILLSMSPLSRTVNASAYSGNSTRSVTVWLCRMQNMLHFVDPMFPSPCSSCCLLFMYGLFCIFLLDHKATTKKWTWVRSGTVCNADGIPEHGRAVWISNEKLLLNTGTRKMFNSIGSWQWLLFAADTNFTSREKGKLLYYKLFCVPWFHFRGASVWGKLTRGRRQRTLNYGFFCDQLNI